jgi:hypothetical protein
MTLPDSADIDCISLGTDDQAKIAEAAAILLDARGIVIRVSEWIGGRLHGLGRHFADLGPHLLGEEWQARYQSLVEGSLRNAYRVGTVGLSRPGQRRPRKRLNKLIAERPAAPAVSSACRGSPPTCR